MPLAHASQPRAPTLETLGNLAYFQFPRTPRGGRAGPVVVGLAGTAEADAFHALLKTCASHAEALAAAGGSRGMRPDKALALPGATLMLDKRRRHPFVVEVDAPLSDLSPSEVLSRLRAPLLALGLFVPSGPAEAPEGPAEDPSDEEGVGAVTPQPVRMSILKSNAWRTSLFTGLEEALEAASRVPDDRAILLSLVTEHASHRPRTDDVRTGARIASDALLLAHSGRLARLRDAGPGFGEVGVGAAPQPDRADAGPILPGGCPGPIQAMPLDGLDIPDTIRERLGRLGADTGQRVAALPVADFVADGGSVLDVERIRVSLRRDALVHALRATRPVAPKAMLRKRYPKPATERQPAAPLPPGRIEAPAVEPAPRPVVRPPTKAWTVLDAITGSIPHLDPEAASYVSRRLCLGKGPIPSALPDIDPERRRMTEAEVAAACRGLPWMPMLGERIGRLRFEAPYPVDRVLSRPWASGLSEQGLSFLMSLALPGCHVVEVDFRPCVVPATERDWRDARNEALAALLSPHAPQDRPGLAEAAWDAMRDRSPELREAVLSDLIPTGPEWHLRMTLHLGGLGKAVAECLGTHPGAIPAEGVRDRIASATGVTFPLGDVQRHLALAGVALADGRYLARSAFPPPAETEALTRAAEALVRSRGGRMSCAEIVAGLRSGGTDVAEVDPAVLDTLLRESGALVDEGGLRWSFARPAPPAAAKPLGRLPTMVATILSDGRERTHKEMLSSVSAMLGSSPSRKAFAAALRRAAQGRMDKGGMVYGPREGQP